ncbi:hypothetical protein GUJ93_ZPchr0001g31847 [Zizania palustris]|uniref:Uncharacterized protein n=1 Tax=Zizania palustris TaxID=103762 RepID=A0A8J5VBU0_ZIZPA|nr:hypothetical protein GUJ93_ZPchr0001g31847 [Zizania palustris]
MQGSTDGTGDGWCSSPGQWSQDSRDPGERGRRGGERERSCDAGRGSGSGAHDTGDGWRCTAWFRIINGFLFFLEIVLSSSSTVIFDA